MALTSITIDVSLLKHRDFATTLAVAGRRTKPGFQNKIENCRQVCPRKIGRIPTINIILGHDVRIDWAWLRDCLFVSC